MTEQSTIDLINLVSRTKLALCKDRFSSYDAEDDNYIVEIKNRRKYYKEKLIEASKLYANFQKAEIARKKFLYVVTDEEGVWVYNITNAMKVVVNLPIRPIECPMTTDFGRNDKITKYSYVLPEDMAKKLNN
jgi:hypothetical protein